MRSNAGMADRQGDVRRLARSASLRFQLALWLDLAWLKLPVATGGWGQSQSLERWRIFTSSPGCLPQKIFYWILSSLKLQNIDFSKNPQISNFMKILSVGVEFSIRTDSQVWPSFSQFCERAQQNTWNTVRLPCLCRQLGDDCGSSITAQAFFFTGDF